MPISYTGKLPAYGDFVEGGGALHACKAWNEWAERGLNAVRSTAGFHDTFLTSPIWRFAVAGDVFSPSPVAGVFCPSMDKVGRLFPFAVLTDLASGVSPLAACTALGGWFDEVEAAVLAALDPAATLEGMMQTISEPAPFQPCAAARPLASTPGFDALSVTMEGEPIATMGDPLDLSDDPSDLDDGVWITLGSIDADAHGIVQHGAATDALFARLVTGGEAHDV